MGRSLFIKLLGAFTLVIVVLAVVTTALVNQATAGVFRAYTDRNGQVWAQLLAPELANYYSLNDTWEGVSGVLQDPSMLVTPESPMNSLGISTITPQPLQPSDPDNGAIQTVPLHPGMGPGGMGTGKMGMGMQPTPTPMIGISQLPSAIDYADGSTQPAPGMRRGPGMGASAITDMWSMMGHRVIVADVAGRVVSDSSGASSNAVLSSEQLAGGESIQVAGQPAGTIIMNAGEISPGTPGGEFLLAMNRSILVAVLAAGAVAMLLGSILFFQITAPVRKLKAAAGAIASGDLSQRVQVRPGDELGDLAMTFNNMAESLSRAETQRQQMIADVAHELRTPLSVMQANLEAMQDGMLPLDAEEIASLHEETVLLSRLVADLHLLSMAEAGQLKLERADVEPGELIRKSTERLYQRALERQVTIKTEIPSALPLVWADADRISQVLGNLVSNALRYTGSGGAVMVKVEEQTGVLVEQYRANEQHQASEVLISVTDTGSGIPQADLPHVFDRFYRADKSRTRSSGGSGLGLAIVKHIVEAHGGKVWAESPVWSASQDEHPGTRISFTIPALIPK